MGLFCNYPIRCGIIMLDVNGINKGIVQESTYLFLLRILKGTIAILIAILRYVHYASGFVCGIF